MEYIRNLDLLKAFGYIVRVVESDFFFGQKTFFTSYMRNMFWATISYKNHAEGEEIMNTSMSVHKTSLPPAVPAQQIMG